MRDMTQHAKWDQSTDSGPLRPDALQTLNNVCAMTNLALVEQLNAFGVYIGESSLVWETLS